MMRPLLAAIAAACLLAACQGGFSSGSAQPNTILPPTNPQSTTTANPSPTGTTAAANGVNVAGNGTAASSSDVVSAYPLAQTTQGIHCPQVQGFTCFLQFNLATNSPSPTPVSPPSPAEPTITLQLSALPANAPASSVKGVTSTLLAVRIHTDADAQLHGNVFVQMTLPKEQCTPGRKFTLELFREAILTKDTHADKSVASFAKYSLNGTTVRFAFVPPAVPIKKDDLWLLILYADGKAVAPVRNSSPTASPSPLQTPSPFQSGPLPTPS